MSHNDSSRLTYPASLRRASIALLPDFVAGAGEAGGVDNKDLSEWTITRRSCDLGFGMNIFDAASDALLSWRVHDRAGVKVGESLGTRAVEGGRVDLTIGPIRSSCEVVALIEEPERTVLTYGTLPGHVERGEETFAIAVVPDRRDAQGRPLIRGYCVAFSRPAWLLAKIGFPVARAGQLLYTGRYLRAMRALGAQ